MSLHNFLSDDKYIEYTEKLKEDFSISDSLRENPIFREVCLAGYYLIDQLQELGCPELDIIKLQWHAGKCSFGRDPWEIHQQVIQDFKNDKLEFEPDEDYRVN